MSDNQSQMVSDLWELFKPLVHEKKRMETAISYIRLLEEHGVYCDELDDLKGTDAIMDVALEEVYGVEEIDDDVDHEDDYEE